jgi:hypothetical protein
VNVSVAKKRTRRPVEFTAEERKIVVRLSIRGRSVLWPVRRDLVFGAPALRTLVADRSDTVIGLPADARLAAIGTIQLINHHDSEDALRRVNPGDSCNRFTPVSSVSGPKASKST